MIPINHTPAVTGTNDPNNVYGGPNGFGRSGIAIGREAAVVNDYGIAIGYRATANGANSIVINAASTSTRATNAANTIVLNAQTSTQIAATTANAFYVAPVRGAAAATPVLAYNTTTKEITCA